MPLSLFPSMSLTSQTRDARTGASGGIQESSLFRGRLHQQWDDQGHLVPRSRSLCSPFVNVVASRYDVRKTRRYSMTLQEFNEDALVLVSPKFSRDASAGRISPSFMDDIPYTAGCSAVYTRRDDAVSLLLTEKTKGACSPSSVLGRPGVPHWDPQCARGGDTCNDALMRTGSAEHHSETTGSDGGHSTDTCSTTLPDTSTEQEQCEEDKIRHLYSAECCASVSPRLLDKVFVAPHLCTDDKKREPRGRRRNAVGGLRCAKQQPSKKCARRQRVGAYHGVGLDNADGGGLKSEFHPLVSLLFQMAKDSGAGTEVFGRNKSAVPPETDGSPTGRISYPNRNNAPRPLINCYDTIIREHGVATLPPSSRRLVSKNHERPSRVIRQSLLPSLSSVAKFANPCYMRSPDPFDVPVPLTWRTCVRRDSDSRQGVCSTVRFRS